MGLKAGKRVLLLIKKGYVVDKGVLYLVEYIMYNSRSFCHLDDRVKFYGKKSLGLEKKSF